MGEITKIAWCDHTFNPWIGCTRVSPGCQHCYAERQNKLYKWNGGELGPLTERRMTSDANWKQLAKWERQAASDGVVRRVFCASLADVLHAVQGMVMLCGYECELYRELYGSWEMVQCDAMADGARPRTECLWFNPPALQKQDKTLSIFDGVPA